ncbi:hypothetical protein CesoFtcFv8_007850 [Champsocephalus esox]|uniref:Uncharacterized protein n=1 Tax=Champsocephalus esox TaxID=159716 RepID=A0AAN8CEE5_9TELE|nr:hypothetical protein CesoFtcFv8_007850 [Champsocephalus esox]
MFTVNGILRERTLTHERVAVRSGSSVNNRPFLCRPSMGESSLHGEFCGGTGRQRVPQLYSCGPTAEGMPFNTVLWGMETQLSVVHPQRRKEGLYSIYFLVPKKTGEFRPILVLAA